MDKLKVKAITTLFMAYGKQNETERIALYCKLLEDIPAEVLQKIVEKTVNESDYLPSVARLREAGRSLMGSVDAAKRVKPWVEVQKEIQQGLSRTWYHGCMGEVPFDDPNFGKPCEPMWSTPEVKATVDSYGLDNMNKVLESDMPIVWSQLRKAYVQACETKKEKEVNTHVLAGTEFTALASKVSGCLK